MKKQLLLGCLTLLCAAQLWADPCENFAANFSYEQNGNTLFFTNQSTGQYNGFVWKFGDETTSDIVNPIHTYETGGTYQVCLVIELNEACRSETCKNITIELPPLACEVTFAYETTEEAGQITLNGQAIPAAVNWTWYVNDDLFSDDGPNVTFNGQVNTAYNFCVATTTAEGCVAEHCETITIESDPCENYEAAFTYAIDETGLGVEFDNQSTGDPQFFVWKFGDDTTDDDNFNTFHQYEEGGTYEVCLVIENEPNCRSEVCQTIVLTPTQDPCENYEAAFTYAIDETGLGVEFDNQSTGDPQFFVWKFGDGTADDDNFNTFHQYEESGTYEVCLVIENEPNCRSEVCQTITLVAVGIQEGKLANPITVFQHHNNLLEINLAVAQVTQNINYSLYDLNGKVHRVKRSVYQQKEYLSTAGLSMGYYVLVIELDNGERFVEKVLLK